MTNLNRALVVGSALNQCLRGVVRVFLFSIAVSALLTPVLWAINQLRNYGLPADLSSVAQAPLYALPAKNLVAALVERYNSSLDGYSRFGSGLGMIAGAFWAMGGSKGYVAIARILSGFAAGALIGLRLTMMITSDPPFVMGGATLGSVWTAVYLYLAGTSLSFQTITSVAFVVA